MCEKPISVDVITTAEVLAKAKSKPHLKFLVPFCRRCKWNSNFMNNSRPRDIQARLTDF